MPALLPSALASAGGAALVNRLRDESEPFRMVVGIISPILLGLVSVYGLQKPANKLAKWLMPATFGGAKKAAEATGETKGDGNA